MSEGAGQAPDAEKIPWGTLSADGRFAWADGEWRPMPGTVSNVEPRTAAATPASQEASVTPYVFTVPAPGYLPQKVTVSAGTAFKIGFFGFFGVMVAALIPWLLFVIFLGAVMGAIFSGVRPSPAP